MLCYSQSSTILAGKVRLAGKAKRNEPSAGADSGKRARMATIDVDKLRDYMTDYFGTAMFNGFPAAILDLSDIESMGAYELCQKAESLGIDLRDFEIE